MMHRQGDNRKSALFLQRIYNGNDHFNGHLMDEFPFFNGELTGVAN